MSTDRIKTGRTGEDTAILELKKKGYKLLEKNYRSHFGEIDIIAEDGDIIAFIEIKTRRSDSYGEPGLSITKQKKERMYKTSLAYLIRNGMTSRRCRFDVVLIIRYRNKDDIQVVKDAFREDDII